MKIIIATGGTGGHIFPALAVAGELKSQGHIVHFVGVFGAFKETILKRGFPLSELTARGFFTNSLKLMLTSCGRMLQSISRSLTILRDLKPDAVLGFGGYGAFPVVLAARFCGVPAVIHEQNVVPGRANRILGRCVNRVAVSFNKSRAFFPGGSTVVTGCPSVLVVGDYDRTGLYRDFGLLENKYTILVLGGSQGSHRINQEFLGAVGILKGSLDFQAIHVAGAKDVSELERAYAGQGFPFRLFEFLDRMAQAYTLADLIISRAGAVTVCEIAAFGKPAVLIPYPWAGNHQRENALVLVEEGLAKMIEEKDLSAQCLAETILSMAQLKTAPQRRAQEAVWQPAAARRLAEVVLDVGR